MSESFRVPRALNELDVLVDELYEREPLGGPLHIVTDDGNVKDSDLIYCYRRLYECDNLVFTKSICLAILHELMLLDEAQRTIWWLAQAIQEEGVDPVLLITQVHGCHVKPRSNGIYDVSLVRPDPAGEDPVVVWEGLEQLRERKKTQGV